MLTFFRKKMKAIMIVVAVVFVGSMFYGIGLSTMNRGSGQKKNTLGKVNGKEIDPFRFKDSFGRIADQVKGKIKPADVAFIQNMALDNTIDFMLILEQAKKKVKVKNQEVDLAIDNLLKQQKISSKNELEKILSKMGLTLAKLKNSMKEEMLVQKMVRKIQDEVKVEPNDLREIKASHILVSEEAQAKSLVKKIKQGESFALLAKNNSIDYGSAIKGGDLGFFGTGAMVPSFEKAAFKLKIGEVSDIVASDFGYHIIKLTDSRLKKFPGEEKDFEKAALATKQRSAYYKWFSELKKEAKIEITRPELLGHRYRARGKIVEAIAEYKKAVAQGTANPYIHIFLAEAYNDSGQFDLAVDQYEAAISLDGGQPEFHLVLAEAYEKAKKYDLAIKEYARASLVAGDVKELHEELLVTFKRLKARAQISHEIAEIARITKKEKFEKELNN